jgi:hypothetical protein
MTYHDRLASTPSRERWHASVYAMVLLVMNAYICRTLFSVQGVHTNSMHGFWAAIADRIGGTFFHPTWWPYWDGGIPFEFTYAPLIPALMAIWAAVRGVPELFAFQAITAIVYCLVPLTLFLCAWRLTRAPGYSFAAALLYSLTSPTQLLMPDDAFRWNGLFDSRRLFMATYWDETPHLLALAMLPLTVLFIARAIETRRRRFYAAAAGSIAIATLASAFGPIATAIAALCLIAALGHKGYASNVLITVVIGVFAYALSAAYLPPSLLSAMRQSSTSAMHSEPGWTAGSLTAFAIIILGWVLLWRYLPRWTSDWKLRFFALFAYLTASIPMVFAYLHRQFLPQPVRYKFEAELALALLIVFGSRAWFERMPKSIRRAVMFLLLALALEQVQQYRADMRIFLKPVDAATTIESRASVWADRNLPGVRVWFPGSIAQWANAFSDVPQFSGGSWSMAHNPVEQRGIEAVYFGDPRVSLAWLQSFGAGAVAVPAANSEEYWKGFVKPEKFDGQLPVLWREGGVTIYKVPQRVASLAHVIPETALVRRAPKSVDDTAELERYAAALEDPSLPPAEMQWEGRNRIHVRTTASPGQVVSIQVSYHPGWHPAVNRRAVQLHRDGMGLMWLQPDCNGACAVDLDYDGGWELRLCRWISVIAFAILLIMFCVPSRNREDEAP